MSVSVGGARDRVSGVHADSSFLAGGGEAGAVLRSIDWQASPLGPLHTWPQSLRTSLGLCLSSRFPIALYWGRDFIMLYNDALLPMVGANKHPWAMARPAFEVLPEIRELIEPLLLRVIGTGEAIWSEDTMLPLVRGDAPEEGYFTFTYSPIRDESGGVGGVFCAVLETTDKVIEERRLRLLNAFAETTQPRTPAEACAFAAAQISRATNDVPFALLYLIDDSGQVARLAGAANIEPGTARAPTEIAVGNDSPWPFGAPSSPGPHVVPLVAGPGGARGAVILPIERGGGGRPHGFLVVGLSPLLRSSPSYARFHNLLAASISQGVSNAEAYAAERKRAESLAELDRAKTTFFSNVSHEFRTPLTLMLAPIQDILAAPSDAPVDRSAVDLLHRNALRLLKLVNTLLEFSRIEAGRVDAVYVPVDLAALTTDLASSFRATIERAGLEFVVDCPALPEPVFVDRDMWEKIVLNLLSNAFKFTFEGSIAVRLQHDDAHVRLVVEDTGTGVPEAELPRMFERFHRIEGARSRSHEGSGIGLALLHELVRLHGGEVRVASKLGAGTTVEAIIPRGRAHLPSARVQAPRALTPTALGVEAYVREARSWTLSPVEAPAIADPLRPPTAGLRERIVFADDNADMRDYVVRLLGERWDIEAVNDGLAALAAIRQKRPDLVLCDVMMPGVDGFGLVREIRNDPTLRTLPVIILSARAGEEETAKGLASGANDYIAKPFSARELLVRVATNLAAARTADEMRERERIQRENLYRHFMQAPFPVCIFRGADHTIELANSQMLRAWGKGPEVVGVPFGEAIPELRGQSFIGHLDGVFRTGVTYEGKAEPARLPTGAHGEIEEHYYNYVYAPLYDRLGAIEGTMVCAFDVSAVVFARQASERAREEAEAAARAQSEVREFQERFVAVLGHDLRNPLSSIVVAAGLLGQRAAQANDASTSRVVARIASSSRRMSRMIEQILDLTRTRIGGGLKVSPTSLDLSAVLTGIVDELRTAHPGRDIRLRCASIIGQWDRDRLEQVFSNLVGNAIHYGVETAPISIDARAQAGRVEVAVHNEGPPISETQCATLFSPFRRGDRDSRSSKTSGLGLGLYISRELVVAHGGQIEVQSSADQGTTFRVTLPRAGEVGT
jgi:signal transduction histidine kinase/CheY-like chemotaxis protein